VIALVLGACAALPAAAQAGSYDVYSCKVGSSFYGNNAWVSSISPAGGNPALFTADTTCAAPGDVLVAALQPSVSYAPASSAALALSAPSNQDHRLQHDLCASCTRPPGSTWAQTRRS
jgi:hypothetical protein